MNPRSAETLGVDPLRLGLSNQAPCAPNGAYVLYWMTSARRLFDNPSLDYAIARCHEFKRPLLVFEPIRIDYPHACERHHRFIVDGMIEHRRVCQDLGVAYLPFVEQTPGTAKQVFASLVETAVCVVGDAAVGGWLRKVTERACQSLSKRVQLIDAVGLVPQKLAEKSYLRAYDFRRFVARELPCILGAAPRRLSLEHECLRQGSVKMPFAPSWQGQAQHTQTLLDEPQGLAQALGLSGPQATDMAGSSQRAKARWSTFLDETIERYGQERHHPDAQVESRQSPYLHYGHMSAHHLLNTVLAQQEQSLQDWADLQRRENKANRWGLSEGADGFVDQLFVWRELSQHLAYSRPDSFEHYEVLPAWAKQSLAEHANDPREALYTLEELDAGQTEDHVWNAAQRQLREEGHIHNYLRMLWGKRVLAWSPTPQIAFERLCELNNRYALDGRDPNSHAGIGWIFGLFDRPWGPERPIYGKIRYMTTASTLRKLKLKAYLQRYAQPPAQAGLF